LLYYVIVFKGDNMLNPTSGEISLNLSGVDRSWKFTMNDARQVEAILHTRRGERVSFMSMFQTIMEWPVEDVVLFMWAGMRHAHKDLTENTIAEASTLRDIFTFRQELADWYLSMIPDELKKKAVEMAQQQVAKNPGKTG
jgi:hypothetical protein